MKIISVLIFLAFYSINVSYGQKVKLISYNIRYDNPNDGKNRWEVRKGFLTNQLKFYEPDIFGIQEGLLHQVSYLDSSLADYDWVGVGIYKIISHETLNRLLVMRGAVNKLLSNIVSKLYCYPCKRS